MPSLQYKLRLYVRQLSYFPCFPTGFYSIWILLGFLVYSLPFHTPVSWYWKFPVICYTTHDRNIYWVRFISFCVLILNGFRITPLPDPSSTARIEATNWCWISVERRREFRRYLFDPENNPSPLDNSSSDTVRKRRWWSLNEFILRNTILMPKPALAQANEGMVDRQVVVHHEVSDICIIVNTHVPYGGRWYGGYEGWGFVLPLLLFNHRFY